MNKIIFISGIRGVGKTTIINYFSKFKNFICLEFYELLRETAQSETTWRKTEQIIGLKIKTLALRGKIVMVALHCAVPHENLFRDIRNNTRRDFSKRFNTGLTSKMIYYMKSKHINFNFFYINVDNKLLLQRIKKDLEKDPQRVGKEYLKNLEKIKKEDYLKFKEIISEFKKQKMKIKHFIISNNGPINSTLNHIKEKIIL